MKFRYVFMFGLGDFIFCALALGAALAADLGEWNAAGIAAGTALVAFLLFELRICIIADGVRHVLVKLTPHVAALISRSIWSAFKCGAVVGVIDAASMVIVGWPCWLLLEWFEGDSGYKLVGWSFKHVGRPEWQIWTAWVVLGIVFMVGSLVVTLAAVVVWNQILKKRGAAAVRGEKQDESLMARR